MPFIIMSVNPARFPGADPQISGQTKNNPINQNIFIGNLHKTKVYESNFVLSHLTNLKVGDKQGPDQIQENQPPQKNETFF